MNTSLKDRLKELVEQKIDSLFVDAHEISGTKSGDIYPEQQWLLEKITAQLSDLLIEQVSQNLDPVDGDTSRGFYVNWKESDGNYSEFYEEHELEDAKKLCDYLRQVNYKAEVERVSDGEIIYPK